MKKFIYSISVLLIGLVFTIFLGGSLWSGDGPITSGTFNSAMMALIFAILFLCATIVFSTFLMIEEMKKIK
ncbi:MAG: hypothetical protein ACQEWI_07865 [Bacillota bacterium]